MKRVLFPFVALLFALLSLPVMAGNGSSADEAIVLTKGQMTQFTSVFSGTRNLIYAKFVADTDGIATITINSDPAPNSSKWMEEGVLAYGSLKTNILTGTFDVEKGHTYYLLYNFATEATGSFGFNIEKAAEGTRSGTAYVVNGDCTMDLHGVEPTIEDGVKVYVRTATWFRIDRKALGGKTLMNLKLTGGNFGDVTISSADISAGYVIGEASGCIPPGMANFKQYIGNGTDDIYINIGQENINGKVEFTFSDAKDGETKDNPIAAALGSNNFSIGSGLSEVWFSYVNNGDNVITIKGVSTTVYSQNGGIVASGADVSTVGFRMGNGDKVVFPVSAAGNINFTIAQNNIAEGEYPDNPIDITNLSTFSITLPSGSSDALRFMKYSASESGTFMYASSNAKMREVAFSATVRDITAGNKVVNVIQQEQTGYYTYTFTVDAGHEYLIEQTLQNGMGKVDFRTKFTAAKDGDVKSKPIIMAQNKSYTLGRKQTNTKYLQFTAPEAGTYLVSAQVKGQVRVYGEEEYNIQRDYANDSEFRNDEMELKEGQSVIFGVTPNSDIDIHIQDASLSDDKFQQDFFVPDYYIIVTKKDESARGFSLDMPVNNLPAETAISFGDCNTYTSIFVPEGCGLEVTETLSASHPGSAGIYFTENGKWITLASQVAMADGVDASAKTRVFTLNEGSKNRTIIVLAEGALVSGTWKYKLLGDAPTGIENVDVTAGNRSEGIYTIGGVKVKSADKAGLYIVNGKKVSVK